MKQEFGWHLPDEDTHFENYLRTQIMKGLTPEYQRTHRDRAVSFCTRRAVAVDIGAHIGLWSRPLTDLFEQVHSFEPMSSFRDILRMNAPKAIVHPFALGERGGTVFLERPKDNSGMAYIGAKTRNSECAKIRTLDSFDLPTIDFMKIDCEGYEFPVLKGAAETLRRCKPVIVVEQKPHPNFAKQWEQYAAIKFLAEACGYVAKDRVVDDWILAVET